MRCVFSERRTENARDKVAVVVGNYEFLGGKKSSKYGAGGKADFNDFPQVVMVAIDTPQIIFAIGGVRGDVAHFCLTAIWANEIGAIVIW